MKSRRYVLLANKIKLTFPIFCCLCMELQCSAYGQPSVLPYHLDVVQQLSGQKYTHGIAWSEDDSKIAFYGHYGNFVNVWTTGGSLVSRFNRIGAWYSGNSISFFPNDVGILTPPNAQKEPLSSFTEFFLQGSAARSEIKGPYTIGAGPVNAASTFTVSGNGMWVAAISSQFQPGPIRVYSMSPFKLDRIIDGISQDAGNAATSVSLSNAGKLLAVGLIDGTVLIYDLSTDTLLEKIPVFRSARLSSPVTSIAMSFSGDLVAAATSSNSQISGQRFFTSELSSVKIFRIKDAKFISPSLIIHDGISDLSFSKQHNKIAFASNLGSLYLWNPSSPTPQDKYEVPWMNSVVSVAFSHDGQRLAVAHGSQVTIMMCE